MNFAFCDIYIYGVSLEFKVIHRKLMNTLSAYQDIILGRMVFTFYMLMIIIKGRGTWSIPFDFRI